MPREGTLIVEFFAAPSKSSAWPESVVAYTSDHLMTPLSLPRSLLQKI
jgi:hypothetical protein